MEKANPPKKLTNNLEMTRCKEEDTSAELEQLMHECEEVKDAGETVLRYDCNDMPLPSDQRWVDWIPNKVEVEANPEFDQVRGEYKVMKGTDATILSYDPNMPLPSHQLWIDRNPNEVEIEANAEFEELMNKCKEVKGAGETVPGYGPNMSFPSHQLWIDRNPNEVCTLSFCITEIAHTAIPLEICA